MRWYWFLCFTAARLLKFVAPSWDEIYAKSIRLAERIRREERIPLDCLVGVSRGGLVLTRILSDLLDIQEVHIIKCEYYSDVDERRRKPKITQKIQGELKGKFVLIVDDVADTGESLFEIKKYLQSRGPKEMKVVTLYTKPWSKVFPDYFVSSTSAWIIFPWELYESIKLLSARRIKTSLSKMKIPRKYVRMLNKMDSKLGHVGK
jgi:uncharacterized protein